jgi:hypothetical protein
LDSFQKSRNQHRQEILTDGLGCAESKLSCLLAVSSRDRRNGFFSKGLHLFRKWKQRYTTGCQRYMSATAIEQWHAKHSSRTLICCVTAGCVSSSSSAARLKFRC